MAHLLAPTQAAYTVLAGCSEQCDGNGADDCSSGCSVSSPPLPSPTPAELHSPLDEHLRQFLPKVRVIRSKERQGLIRARLIGARSSTGDVLTFLDSHCEVNVGWLEPLLARLKDKPQTAVMPLIEIINSETLEYQLVGLNLGGFSWELVFNWDQPGGAWSASEQAKPRPSPTMAGGLFSIYRNFFFEVGSYDEGMDVWGGENLELSFRVSDS